jgi:choline dehydrogenase-like flavoprotein
MRGLGVEWMLVRAPNKMRKLYDAIIVGSGASGSWVAKGLTEQGLCVLMLEAGKKAHR